MILAINYADSTYREAQKVNSRTAKKIGRVDEVREYGPADLDSEFVNRNSASFRLGDRQVGKHGLWRPFVVADALSRVEMGDYVMYSDSGCYFVSSVRPLVAAMERDRQDIMVFELPFLEREWTRRDVFVHLGCDVESVWNSNQFLSTIFLARKSSTSLAFFNDYRATAINAPQIFTDSENQFGLPNHESFIENRHNQSVLSVLAKKYGLVPYRDPSEYGIRPALYRIAEPRATYRPRRYRNSDYGQIIVSHRSPTLTPKVRALVLFRRYFPIVLQRTWIALRASKRR